jgi:ribosomal protein L11 methylase PrmA
MIETRRSAGSFRDPDGFIFERNGTLFRQVNQIYREQYDRLIHSGLYQALVDDGLLIPHEESDAEPFDGSASSLVIRPSRVPFISYPYEWCAGQLKAAALATLAVERRAVQSGMSLKDASAYNIQFVGGKPVFIDTLSFETYREGEPWVAYRQFCQHFLAPLALISFVDVRLSRLCHDHMDGVPLDLASRLLPFRTRLGVALGFHVHLHSRLQSAYSGNRSRAVARKFSRASLLGLIDSLESAIRKCDWKPKGQEWVGYYGDNTYSHAAAEHKRRVLAEFVDQAKPVSVWDLGANTGAYSRVASDRGINTIAFDLDPGCVELNYRETQRRGETHLLPLVLDLRNPSPASGWRSEERMSLTRRGPADLIIALALIHHLVFTGNLPLSSVAEYFAQLGRWLVIEFVPPDDPQVLRLSAACRGKHHAYDQAAFEDGFGQEFEILSSQDVADCRRRLYLMRRRIG